MTVKLDRAALRSVANSAASEIVRTLAFETLEVATEEIQVLGAIDTGNMRATGYFQTGEGERSGGEGVGGADVEWTPGGPTEAKVAYGAEYAEYVHEGYGSNSSYGPRPFLTNAQADVGARARAIAQEIVDRKFGG